jgi:glycosyltransferase involved in cell wall biosynthesis
MTPRPKICFLVGSMALSGGTYVIIQHAVFLQKNGFEITLAVQEAFTKETLVWHDEANLLRCIPIQAAKPLHFDLVIATWWKTALELPDFSASRYAYFVQSIESRFYSSDEAPLRQLVDETYRLPVSYITEATWIQRHLRDHFHQEAALVRNGIRKDIYKIDGTCIAERNPGKPRVLVEGHFGVPFKNTALAVRLAKEARAKDIWVLTGSNVSWLPGVSKVFSRIPMVETPRIYRSCDILLKLSTVEGMFGPPLEIFHCGGTSVVFNVTGHDEYIVDGYNSRVVETGRLDQAVEKLKSLLQTPRELQQLKDGAKATAEKWHSWQESSARFHVWVLQTLNFPATHTDSCKDIVTRAWLDYGREEKKRLADNPAIARYYKRSEWSAKIPSPIKQRIKKLQLSAEVCFGRRKAF